MAVKGVKGQMCGNSVCLCMSDALTGVSLTAGDVAWRCGRCTGIKSDH